jgi:hypothetical protein
MIEEEKIVVLSLSPEEHENRLRKVANYILNQKLEEGWIFTEKQPLSLKRYQFDANYNRYYIKLKFEKSAF